MRTFQAYYVVALVSNLVNPASGKHRTQLIRYLEHRKRFMRSARYCEIAQKKFLPQLLR